MPPDSPMFTVTTMHAAYEALLQCEFVGPDITDSTEHAADATITAFLAAQDHAALTEVVANAIAGASGRNRPKQRPYVRREAQAVVNKLLGVPDAA
jgi:hypothetical protein